MFLNEADLRPKLSLSETNIYLYSQCKLGSTDLYVKQQIRSFSISVLATCVEE